MSTPPANPFRDFVAWMPVAIIEKGAHLGITPISAEYWKRLEDEGYPRWVGRQNCQLKLLYECGLKTAIRGGYPPHDAGTLMLAAFEAGNSLMAVEVGYDVDCLRDNLHAELVALNLREEAALRPFILNRPHGWEESQPPVAPLFGDSNPSQWSLLPIDEPPSELLQIGVARRAILHRLERALRPVAAQMAAAEKALQKAARGLDPLEAFFDVAAEVRITATEASPSQKKTKPKKYANKARDKWLYEKYAKTDQKLGAIVAELNRIAMAKKWMPVAKTQSVIDAARRYAKHARLPEPSRYDKSAD